MQRACLAVLLQHERDGALPTSARFVFYELVQAGAVPKRATGKRRADQDTIDALMHLREKALAPWEWLADETRTMHSWRSAATVAAYLADTVKYARIDCWSGKSAPLILCESRTFGGVLSRRIAPDYLCPVAATNGQCGGFLVTEVAPWLRDNQRVVLYVGDHDLAGGLIEANTHSVLERHAHRQIDWRRLALTAEQVTEHNLPVIEKRDRRFKDGRPHEAVEVEALGQLEVEAIVREGLDDLLPEPLANVLEREDRQREQVEAALED